MKHIRAWHSGLVLALWQSVAQGQLNTDFTYTVTGQGVTITGYTGAGGAVTIPSSINGLPVSAVGHGVFQGRPQISSLAIPRSVAQIEQDALFACDGLLAINVDPDNQFYSSLDGVLFDKARAALLHYPAANAGSYTVPGSVTSIEVEAFAGSTGLVSVTIPSNVSLINLEAFEGCPELTNVFFKGNAPSSDPTGSVFLGDANATVYYLPGTTGWDWQPLGRPPLGYPDYEYLPAVPWNPQAHSPALRNGQFGFDIAGTTNIPIVVEAATNLTDGPWVALQSGLLAGGLLHFSDPSWTNFPARFYRIRWP